MVKVLHAADLHLDSAFVGCSEAEARARRAGQRKLLETIVELANEAKVDLLLLAGDVLDGRHAYFETAEVLSESLAKCRAHVFLACGNHDPFDAASPYRNVRFSENVHLFCSPTVESVELPELGCVIHGAGFSSSVCEIPLLAGFSAPNDGRVHLLVLHGECTEGASENNPIRKRDLEQSGVHYAALGHIHKGTSVQYVGKTAYAYPGCPEGRGFDECGEKGVLVGYVATDRVEMKFLPLGGQLYEEKTLQLHESDSIRERLSSLLPECAKNLHLRVVIEGESDPIDCAALEAEFSHRVGSLVLKDRTRQHRSPWEGEFEQSLKGAFLRRLHKAYETAEPEAQAILLRAAILGVSAMEDREGAL
ncbi:MAG: DNA repair exonuclease [Oscillospiraceae bacterium]|nr:DNA repair exonuclease [Oscillospiraceae bacterium]